MPAEVNRPVQGMMRTTVSKTVILFQSQCMLIRTDELEVVCLEAAESNLHRVLNDGQRRTTQCDVDGAAVSRAM